MSRLTKEKRNQLVLATMLIVAVMAGLWFGLIRYQQQGLEKLANRKGAAEEKLRQIQDTIKKSDRIEADLASLSKTLELWEDDMASGDLYSWMINSLTKFQQAYKVDVPVFNKTEASVDMNLLPKFPYKQYMVTVFGTAYYHEFGRFVADFENRFPSSRVLNLELFPASTQNPEDREKLSFKIEVVSLVKPGGTRLASSP